MIDLKEGLEHTLGPGYSVERELSGGGMSRVFVANDTTLGRRVVVKVLPSELAASVSVERFKREIMLAATLQHPHIVGVLSAGEIVSQTGDIVERVPYFTMPFVEGESLRARIQREGQLPIGRAVSILKDVARALAYAHERGVVHRDIKPDNVLLAGTSATVTDFGIAKALLGSITGGAQPTTGAGGVARSGLTALGTTLGTPAYMAPEQAAADPNTDHRADIYSFGIMAYEMLTGQVPFKSSTPQALLAAQLTAAPPPIPGRRIDVPAALATLVMACLEKDPGRRPQSARELAEMLENPEMVSGAFASAPQPAVRGRRTLPIVLGAVAVAIVIAVAGGIALMSQRRGQAVRAAAARDSVQAIANERARSIAILPFVNIGRDSADEYLADGLTNDLINALAKVPGLRVTSLSAARAARERFSSSAEIGRALNAGRILEGTVQRDGKRLRVTARVSNAADGFMVWSDMFERQINDVFAVQDEISGSIARVLGAQMASATTTVADSRGTTSDAAYDLYLRGRYFFDRRGSAALRKALGLFSQSAKEDTTFAAAYAGIANVYAVLAEYAPSLALDTLFSNGLAAATHAIRLDSTLAEAYAARGGLLGDQWRWADAERDLKHAIALAPRYALAEQWYGEQLLMQGRTNEAVAHLERAAALEPVSAVIASSYSMALGIAHRDANALVQARRAIELDSTFFLPRLVLGMDHLIAGRPTAAIGELEQALGLGSSAYVKGALGYAYVMGGQRASAAVMLRDLAAAPDPNALAASALVQIATGDTAQALANLESAASRHASFFNAFPLSAPLFNPLRSSPRFAALLRTVRVQ
jgi:TolB-like protein